MNDEIELDVGGTPSVNQVPEVPVETETPKRKVVNAILRDDFTMPNGTVTGVNYTFALPSYPRDVFTELVRKAQNDPDLKLDTEGMKKWVSVSEESVNAYTPGSLYQDRFRDPESLWMQGTETNDKALSTISRPKFKNATGELKGEVALLKVSKTLGLGDTLTIPLPHSGLVVTIKPPKERDIIDFYNSVFREKIYLGRMSAGLTLSNFSVYINNRLFNFILKHIHSVNLKDVPKEELANHLLIHDFHILAWGFAATQYPNGFDFERVCSADLKKCNHVERDVINMLKLLWVDNSMLTEIQKTMITDFRPNQMSIADQTKYLAEHVRVRSKDHTLKNGMKFRFKVPTFADHISDGMAWVSKINTDIDNVITDPESEDAAKTELLMQYVNSSMLRQFSHFIEYIEINAAEGGGDVILNRETINSTLELLSSDDDIRPELMKAILDFKSFTTIGLIGIPEYDCPECGEPQNTEPVNDRLVSVIPLDVLHHFFTLLTLRMSRILERG